MTTSSARRNAAFAADTDYADVVPRGDTCVGVAKSLVIVVMRQFAKGQDGRGSGKLKGVRAVCEVPPKEPGVTQQPFSTRPPLSTELSTQVVYKQQLMKPIMAGVEAVLLGDESHPHGLSA